MNYRQLIATVAVAGFVSSFTAAMAADPMGSVVAVAGRPTAAGPGGSRPLSAGSDVFEGDTITVGDGNAQMQLDDGTKLVVGPSSRLILQSYLRRNATTARKVGVKALRGTFRIITGKSAKSAYKISTSNATIGIRGTGFDFTVTSRTIMAVHEGSVRLRGRNQQGVNLESGCNVGEAGSGIKAKELEGEAKSNALKNELRYSTNQNDLRRAFHLPIKNCLTSLGSNEQAPGIQPQQLLPLVPAIAIPGIIIAVKDKNPVSEPSPRCFFSNGQFICP